MGLAFRTDTATVTVAAQDQVTQDFAVDWFQWTCGVIEGTVTEEDNGPISGALVKAYNGVNEFLGITDENGFYAICVPPGTYNLYVLCCPSTCFTPTSNTCGPG